MAKKLNIYCVPYMLDLCFTDTAQSVSTEKLPASQTDTTEVLSDPSTLEKERKNVFEGK